MKLRARSIIAGLDMFSKDDRFDIATNREIAYHTHPTRSKKRDEIIEDGVSR